MRERNFIKGNTIEKQLDSMDKVLSRFSRRLHKSVVCATPPSILSQYTKELPEDGVIFRTIFPCEGFIKKIVLHYTPTEKEDKSTLDIVMTNGVRTNAFTVKTYRLNIDNIPIITGDLLAIKFNGNASMLWVSILFVPSISIAEKESMAISHLEGLTDEIADGE